MESGPTAGRMVIGGCVAWFDTSSALLLGCQDHRDEMAGMLDLSGLHKDPSLKQPSEISYPGPLGRNPEVHSNLESSTTGGKGRP